MTGSFAHLADDRDAGRPKCWDGELRGHVSYDSTTLLHAARSAGFSASRYSMEVVVANRPIRTNAEVAASVEGGRRECR